MRHSDVALSGKISKVAVFVYEKVIEILHLMTFLLNL